MKNKEKYKILLFRFAAGVIVFCAVFAMFLEFFNLNKIARGVSASGVIVGGLSVGEAVKVLEEKFAKSKDPPFVFVYQREEFKITPDELGIDIDEAKTAVEAFSIGRGASVFSGILEQAKVLFLGKEIAPKFFVDKNKFSAAISEKMGILEKPAENASLIYDKKSEVFALKPAKIGKITDKNSLQAEILVAMAEFKTAEIAIKIIGDSPQVEDGETAAAKEKAEAILALAPYEISADDFGAKLQKEDILDFLEFSPVEGGFGEIILGVEFNGEEIKNYLVSLAPSINRQPINAVLAYEAGKVKEFALSKDGIVLKIDESVLKIKEALVGGEKKISLEIERIKPQITTDSIENLGITSLLAKGESDFAGSPKSRVHNIKIGAAKFNGVLLKPGEEFSFNAILGEVDEKGGYLPELVIKQNKTTPEYGGGICQVSTTAFRGAMFAGLEILERAPHSFPVRYYNPQGFDATVYPPSPDFKFKNDTPAHLLLQTKVKGTKITFEFYGTSDGRTVKLDGPKILEQKEDGSMKTVLHREIYDKDGNLVRKSTFRSNYKSPDLYPIERNPLE